LHSIPRSADRGPIEAGLLPSDGEKAFGYQYGAAEPLYRRALCILESTPGPAHPYTAVAEIAMAKFLLVQHRNTEAEALLNKAVAVFESSHEPDNPNLSIALVCLAEAYRTDGRYLLRIRCYGVGSSRARDDNQPQTMRSQRVVPSRKVTARAVCAFATDRQPGLKLSKG
jgi:hypothetical protein